MLCDDQNWRWGEVSRKAVSHSFISASILTILHGQFVWWHFCQNDSFVISFSFCKRTCCQTFRELFASTCVLDIQRGKTTRESAVARKNWQSLLKILTWKNSIHTNTYAVQICYLSTAETQSSNEILKSRKVFNREDWIQFFLTRKVTALIFPLRPAEALTKPKSCNRSVVVDQKHERRI